VRHRKTSLFLICAARLALPAAALLVACGRSPRPVRVAGRTVGPAGAPLADVRVILEIAPGDSEEGTAVERVETTSDSQGNFSIDYQGHWRRASYRLEARKPGYEKLSIEDVDSAAKPLVIRLTQTRP
jgi:hypothetical protein